MSAITSLRSYELSGLLPPSDSVPHSRLATLSLNNTGIDDDVAPFIAGCPNLLTLQVSGTKLTGKFFLISL
jgi:hypothetical protein